MSSKYYFLLIILFFLNIDYSFNKNPKKSIKLIHADFIQKKDHNDIVFLTGHVHFKHNEYHLFCDQAIYKKNNQFYGYGNVQLKSEKNKIFSQKIEYSENMNNLKASGKVILVQGNIKLTANTINYNFRKKFLQAIKNVILFLDEFKLYTNILEYDLNLKKIFYKKGSFLFYKDYNIYSKEGFFFPLKKKAKLKYEVKLISKNYTVYSNSIEYLFSIDKLTLYSPTIIVKNNNKLDNFFYAKSGTFFLKKNIFLSKEYCSLHYNDKIIKGKYWFFDHNKKYGFIKNVLFEDKKKGYFFIGDNGNFDLDSGLISLKRNTASIKIDPKEDSFFIYSDKIIINLKKDSIFSIQFFPVIGFFLNEELQIKSDSLRYEPSNNSIKFNGNPIFWIKKQQITGDSISIHLKNGFFLDYLKIIKNAFYIKKINLEEFNQIKGEIMIGFFDKKNVLEKILVQGDAESLVFLYNNPLYNGKKIINKSSCKIIYADLEKGKKIKKISCLEKANSKLIILSNNRSKKNLFFSKFSWREDEKSKNKKYLIYEKMKKYRKENLEENEEIKKLRKKN
ncbi:hypothetical protein DM815_03100 [Blattabacterium sp. (Cryptocercus kyebangensis)]|uniref:OstA-like protein n=1 Tax=Blattabacterium sp. (Cryptocercus kyebangensis) TaxID=298656 RepID=UPI000D7BC020|nr:OstA-like protein [Blattabacterium sp. (Cryptocercus kyebangensis)]AWU43983.1 hypothetical protein DM815_03100 [Blattabacterium sp. (Cryptocercus kyebangensis)]